MSSGRSNENEMVSPTLKSPRDSPLSPEFSPPDLPASVRQSLRFANMVETATNDVGPLASIAATSAAPAATLRSAIASDENAPGLLLRVYEDLRDRIAQSRQTTYSEVAPTVTNDLSTNIDQLKTPVDSLNSECRSLRVRLAAAEDRVRDLKSSPVSTAPLANIPTPTPPVTSVPYPIPFPPVNHAHTSQVGAASETPTTPHISTPISRSNVSAATPYPSSLPHPTIPNITLSHRVTYEQFLRGELPTSTTPPHPSHTLSSLHTLQPRTPLYVTNRVPGLEPKRTLLPPFATVVSYDTYRIHDKRTILYPNENLGLHRIKRKPEGLIPTLKPFNGTNGTKHLRYFAELRHGFDSLGVPEAAAVRSLHFLLDGEARTFYELFAARGTLSATRSREFTWPHAVYELLDQYLTDSELQKAYGRVALISQRPAEDEKAYADRIIAASHDFSNLFQNHTLVHYYVRGLLETSSDKVIEDMRRLPEHEQCDLTSIRRLAFPQGNTVRAQSEATAKARTHSHRRTPTMYVSEEQPPEPYFRNPELPHLFNHPAGMLSEFRVRGPETARNIATGLEIILFMVATSG